ncbi:MAG: sigma-70 family RNA polymerase sigma factor [Candidatus Alectryocaccobium sp.]|jgi:RNA polymerase sporulation-specific sigma factor|nr:sigma-70 family RNA polymerase sigma factor [Lachnospiraceae bacterium]MDY6221809.1 sigma-70 family RNA polymerase sigma factor [Candidatus Alectryocaccobium sp.]
MDKTAEKLTDEELIGIYRKGSLDAMTDLIIRYKPLVKNRARLFYLEGGDREDLLQEGMIGLFKAIKEYDAEKEASFATFARLCITRQMLSAIEAAGRKKHMLLNESLSIEQLDEGQIADRVGVADGPEKIFFEQEDSKLLMENINRNLSKMEKQVLDLYISGMDYLEIADMMGKSGKSIDNALQRIRNKIKKAANRN